MYCSLFTGGDVPSQETHLHHTIFKMWLYTSAERTCCHLSMCWLGRLDQQVMDPGIFLPLFIKSPYETNGGVLFACYVYVSWSRILFAVYSSQ